MERSYKQVVEQLSELRNAAHGRSRNADGTTPRWDERTPEQLEALDEYTAYDGLLWGYTGLRMSMAAENYLKTQDDLEAFARLLILSIQVKGSPIAVGAFVAEVNGMARNGVQV